MRRFSLYKRNGIFYCRFWNPETKTYTSAKSTGEYSKKAAMAVVYGWEQYGLPGESSNTVSELLRNETLFYHIKHSAITQEQAKEIVAILQTRKLLDSEQEGDPRAQQQLISFLKQFWDYDTSPYVKEKHAFGHSIGKRHCYEQLRRLHHWEDFFSKPITISNLTREQLQKFQLSLRDKVAPKTANMILSAGTVALNWAKEQQIISANPAEGLKKFSGASKKRDILTKEEVKKLFSIMWDDNRSRVGNLLAMTTGLRAGEIVALKKEDILDDHILVRHSWSFADGLKKPKNGEERTVPLLQAVREELLSLLQQSPFGQNGFIFYGTEPDKPMNIDVLSRGLTNAYIQINLENLDNITVDEKKSIKKQMVKRGICFHSWRHFYTANLADRIEMRTVQLATGHKTTSVAEHYANHKQASHLDLVSKAVADLYEQINLDTTVVPAS